MAHAQAKPDPENHAISGSARPPRSLPLCLLFLGALLAGSGCATYSDHTAEARNYAQRGDYDSAIAELDKLLGVEDGHAHPEKFRDDSALVLLERGMLHQARGDYDGSREDLQVADKQLELLDLSNTAVQGVARYFYSDSAGPYRISPVERLSLNALNMLNYLAVGDLGGARVEAKRFTVMRNYLRDTNPDYAHGAIGSYLAGFVHQQLGEDSRAMRHYNDALQGGRIASLAAPVRGLAERVSVRGTPVWDLLAEPGDPPVRGGGEILVVTGVGRVPMDAITNLGAELVREYEKIKSKIIAAALSRMVARAVVAEGARKIGKEVGNGGELAGVLAGLLSESLLVAADKPDTRSWTLLPNKIFVSRKRVPAGTHQVDVGLGLGDSVWQRFAVDVPEGGYALVIVTPLH